MVRYYSAENYSLEDWLNQASDDLRTAQDYINKDENYARKNVCIHSHQSIEKNLKAYLIANKVDIPDSHNLEKLQGMCEEIDGNFSKVNSLNLRNLTGLASDSRYPQFEHEKKIITAADAKKAYNSAVEINDFVLNRIKEIDKEPDKTGPEPDIDF